MMRKRLISLLLYLMMVIGLVPASAASSDFDIQERNDDIVLVKYNGTDAHVEIPSGVTVIGSHAFSNTETVTSVVIPDGVQRIEGSAFYHCASIKTVTFPEDISIEIKAFEYCSGLTSIFLPKGAGVMFNSFYRCAALTTIEVDSEHEELQSIDNVLYSPKYHTLILCPMTKEGKVEIPEGIKVILDSAFYSCTKITEVVFPSSLVEIQQKAFWGCSSLTELMLPAKLGFIFEYAFRECVNLETVSIPPSVKWIENNMNNDPKVVTHILAHSNNAVIHCDQGSAIEKYAKENNIPYTNPYIPLAETQELPQTTPPQTASAPAPTPTPTATPTSSPVLVDGDRVAFDAYKINDNNYFKLRDLAYVLSGTAAQFAVTWDNANQAINLVSGSPYRPVGGEMTAKGSGEKTPTASTAKIYLDGALVNLTAYTIDGNNYFKLRDLGEAFDFDVTWDNAANAILIDTASPYTPD